jgi:rhamnulokinase
MIFPAIEYWYRGSGRYMCNYYLAIDIGASRGRHILGHLSEGKIILEEVHRFDNGMQIKDGELCWDLERIFDEIKLGMKKCKEIGKVPKSVGIDTWAVDFVLVDKMGKVLGNTAGYRDSRTQGMDEEVYSIIPEERLYQKTGIQKQIFNTIYQLMAVKKKHPEYMNQASSMLMIPDYLHYLLSGVRNTEYTNATTTQLVSPITKKWDIELIKTLGFPERIFQDIAVPGTTLGNLTNEIKQEIGYDCSIVLPATHDTASAVMAVPSNEDKTLYISSGTWSLMGTERLYADCSLKSKLHNLTNEGGYAYRFRYLKNIMGLWMIQSVRKEFESSYSYSELCEMASKTDIQSVVDCNDNCFLAPGSMLGEIRRYCKESGQQVPVTDGEIAAVIYKSLAQCYSSTLKEIEELTGLSYERIHVVGGGANADYLNKLTAQYTKRKVFAGPVEATAIGNLSAQMIAAEELRDLQAARNSVYNSFDIKEF